MKVGIRVQCVVCGNTKKPVGRSAPMGATYCADDECVGYWLKPMPGDLWPGETEEQFGYPVSNDATEERDGCEGTDC